MSSTLFDLNIIASKIKFLEAEEENLVEALGLFDSSVDVWSLKQENSSKVNLNLFATLPNEIQLHSRAYARIISQERCLNFKIILINSEACSSFPLSLSRSLEF